MTYENVYPKQKVFSASITTDEGERECWSATKCWPITTCCFCISLKTGCFILGYINLALNFLITLFYFGTLAVLGIYTHGFKYIHMKYTEDGERVPDEDSIKWDKLNYIIATIVTIAVFNIAWFAISIVLLVGLHRKRPGHIKLHVTAASIRLLASIIGIILYGAHTPTSMTVCCIEIGLSAYFILVYYTYAMQLEREYERGSGESISESISAVVLN